MELVLEYFTNPWSHFTNVTFSYGVQDSCQGRVYSLTYAVYCRIIGSDLCVFNTIYDEGLYHFFPNV